MRANPNPNPHPDLVLGRARVEDLDEQLDLLECLQPRLQLDLVAVLLLRVGVRVREGSG